MSGESFTYLGRNYRLKLVEDSIEQLKLTGGKFVLGTPYGLSEHQRRKFVKSELEDWYIKHALERLVEKTNRLSKQVGVEPKSISVRSYKSRWGSCSPKGDVSYNWKIIIAPHRIVDYIVIHELCHMVHHNHSEAFWTLLGNKVPDYQESKEWLKINASNLVV